MSGDEVRVLQVQLQNKGEFPSDVAADKQPVCDARVRGRLGQDIKLWEKIEAPKFTLYMIRDG